VREHWNDDHPNIERERVGDRQYRLKRLEKKRAESREYHKLHAAENAAPGPEPRAAWRR